MIGEVGCQRREYKLNRKRRVCAVIWALILVRKREVVSKRIYFGY